jgi:addiction module HigA family antidote
LPALGKTKSEIAALLGVSRQSLHNILREQAPITPEMAVRIGKLCGNGPGLWVRMQAAHDLWHAERNVDVSRIPTLSAA